MIDSYRAKKKDIIEALEDIAKFLIKLQRVQNKSSNVIFESKIRLIPITEDDSPFKWEIDLKLYKHEI